MRVGILGSLAALLAATSVVTAQVAPTGPLPSYSPLAHPDGWEPSGCCNCGYDDGARPTNQFYSSAEFLVWNFRNDRLPPDRFVS